LNCLVRSSSRAATSQICRSRAIFRTVDSGTVTTCEVTHSGANVRQSASKAILLVLQCAYLAFILLIGDNKADWLAIAAILDATGHQPANDGKK